MAHVIGHGRYARETYPSPPAASAVTPWQADSFTPTIAPAGVLFEVQDDAGIVVTGIPTESADWYFNISTTGAPGTGKFDLSDDGGSTWLFIGMTIPTGPYTMPDPALSATFPATNTAGDISEWLASYDSTITLGDGAAYGSWRTVGGSMDIEISVTIGTTTSTGTGSGYLQFPLPTGFSIDAAAVPGAPSLTFPFKMIPMTILSTSAGLIIPIFVLADGQLVVPAIYLHPLPAAGQQVRFSTSIPIE